MGRNPPYVRLNPPRGGYRAEQGVPSVKSMKSTPLILAAGVIFGAIYGTNALLPDMYDNPTSEVQAGQARIPGLSCTEEDGSTSREPRWDCGGTQIRAKEVGVQDKDQATRRYLRAMGEGTAMPEGDIDRDGDKRTLSDGDLVAISIEGDSPTTFLSLRGPRAEELAQEVEKA